MKQAHLIGKRVLWYFINVIIFINPLFPFTSIKPMVLKLFGAKIEGKVLIKPRVNIKYPWFLEVGVWVGAHSVICPGVTCGEHSVLTVGSIAVKDLQPYGIYQGNLALIRRQRVIT
jgi:putative colanic acid biosynthesis acetyltransferase WcaF